jgi:hypothetical protein
MRGPKNVGGPKMKGGLFLVLGVSWIAGVLVMWSAIGEVLSADAGYFYE